MRHGIAIVGGNGSGKTTLGKRLAGLLGYRHMDIENYAFKTSAIPYAAPRTREEIQALLLADIKKHGSFVLSAVNCDFGDEINAFYDCILCIRAPLAVRLARVRQRSVAQFGARVREDGDLYEQEQAFFHFVASRTMDQTDAWLQRIERPVLYVDGTEPVESSIKKIEAALSTLFVP